jgi:hypothetical protein
VQLHFTPGKNPYTARHVVNSRTIAWLEELRKLKKDSMTSSGIEAATFQLVA